LGSKVKNERLKLEEVLFDEYIRKGSRNESWVSDGEIVYREPDGSVMLHNVATDWKKILASNASLVKRNPLFVILVRFSSINVDRYLLSADQKYILLMTEMVFKNMYSYRAKYKIYDTRNSAIDQFEIDTVEGDFDYVEWGPKRTQMVVVSKNNILYIPSYERRERAQQLTNSGREGVIYNGIPDLLYEGKSHVIMNVQAQPLVYI
ncbi:dipeptidyl aminopeptidase-like protein 6, partial [Dinothrombium tinctorium]